MYRDPEEALRSNLVPKILPDLAQLAALNHCSSNQLPQALGSRMSRHFNTRGNASDYERALPDIEFAFHCWNLVTSGDKQTADIFGNTLNSYPDFTETYVPKLTSRGYSNILRMTGVFRNTEVYPSRLIEIYPKNTGGAASWNGNLYMANGQWVYLPHENWKYNFVEKEALEEIVKNPDLQQGFYAYHSTNSVALNGIEKHNAIICSNEALQRGQEVTSGEHVFARPKWSSRGLNNIYGKSGMIKAYGIPGWFDSYPLTFRIDLERLNYYREEEGGGLISYYDDVGGDGIPMGREVPLRFVDAVYGYSIDLPKLKTWVSKVNPDFKVYSYESREVLMSLLRVGKDYNFLSNSQFVKPEEAIVI